MNKLPCLACHAFGVTARRFVPVGGYSQDVSHVPVHVADLPKSAVVASQVVDRETRVTFAPVPNPDRRGVIGSGIYIEADEE